MNERNAQSAAQPGGGAARPSVPASEKVAAVLRMLSGAKLSDLAERTGRPAAQLRAWRRSFLQGGEDALGRGPRALERLQHDCDALKAQVDELRLENERLVREIARYRRTSPSTPAAVHPNCSQLYARTLEEDGVQVLSVPEWRTHVLVRRAANPGGRRTASGMRPYASLHPDCDLQGGLQRLRQEGLSSISLITDPAWCPPEDALREAFDVCRPFKTAYIIDRNEGPVRIRKRHRNRANSARKTCEVQVVSFRDHLDRWWELYQHHANAHAVADPFTRVYFERLADMKELTTLAVCSEGRIVTITTWLTFQDIAYYHDAASDERGHTIHASHLAFAEAIQHFRDHRFLVFGGCGGFIESPTDGLAEFKRGFSNASRMSYLCSAIFRAQ